MASDKQPESLLVRPEGARPPPPPAEVGRILNRLSVAMAMTAVGHLSELGVFDTMAKEQHPLSAAEIAKRNGNGLNPDMLQRALRTVAVDGWVTENDRMEFSLADARFLVSGKQSLKHLFEVWTICPSHQNFRVHYGDVLKTNQDVARKSLGDDVWGWFDKHPRERSRFADAMTDMTSQTAPAVASHFNFSKFSTVVDLGGSQGVLSHAIKKAHPAIKAISFDLPALTDDVKKNPLEGVEYVAGSFFDSVPEADVYTASHILHDWADEKCIEILACVKKAIRPNGRIILVEGIMPEAGKPFDIPFLGSLDLVMASLLNAKERTLSEWERLLNRGGFALVAVSDNIGPARLIEAAPK